MVTILTCKVITNGRNPSGYIGLVCSNVMLINCIANFPLIISLPYCAYRNITNYNVIPDYDGSYTSIR